MSEIDDQNACFVALGKFLLAFARAEHMLKVLLMGIAGMPHKAGFVVYATTNVTGILEQINSLLIARVGAPMLLPEHEPFKVAFAQLGNITDMRNRLVHQGIDFGYVGTTPNFTTSVKPGPDERRYPVSPTILDQMTADLGVITKYVQFQIRRLKIEGEPEPAKPAANDWKYLHPQPPTMKVSLQNLPGYTGEKRNRGRPKN